MEKITKDNKSGEKPLASEWDMKWKLTEINESRIKGEKGEMMKETKRWIKEGAYNRDKLLHERKRI